ncbi:MAG: hypothetical protein AAFR60_10075 [Pseudomonadota bacterium]
MPHARSSGDIDGLSAHWTRDVKGATQSSIDAKPARSYTETACEGLLPCAACARNHSQGRQKIIVRIWVALALCVAMSSAWASPASADSLSASELVRLLDPDGIGSTISIGDNDMDLFYSSALTNTARRSRAIGPKFLGKSLVPSTIQEGVFVASIRNANGTTRRMSGLAGIADDRNSGRGVVFLVETRAADRSPGDITRPKQLRYAVLSVVEAGSQFTCRMSDWNFLRGGETPKFRARRCRVSIGTSDAIIPSSD